MRIPVAIALAIAVTGALTQRAPAVEGRFQAADRFEMKLLEQMNDLRERRGLAPLRRSQPLSSAAHRHSTDMARNGFCGHDSSNGASFSSRLSRYYGRRAGWRRWTVAENVLCHPRRLTAAAALGAWLTSPGHRANLLSPQWRDVGLGAVNVGPSVREVAGGDAMVVTADFGMRE
jgi:uncharacterized protein YkwD